MRCLVKLALITTDNDNEVKVVESRKKPVDVTDSRVEGFTLEAALEAAKENWGDKNDYKVEVGHDGASKAIVHSESAFSEQLEVALLEINGGADGELTVFFTEIPRALEPKVVVKTTTPKVKAAGSKLAASMLTPKASAAAAGDEAEADADPFSKFVRRAKKLEQQAKSKFGCRFKVAGEEVVQTDEPRVVIVTKDGQPWSKATKVQDLYAQCSQCASAARYKISTSVRAAIGHHMPKHPQPKAGPSDLGGFADILAAAAKTKQATAAAPRARQAPIPEGRHKIMLVVGEGEERILKQNAAGETPFRSDYRKVFWDLVSAGVKEGHSLVYLIGDAVQVKYPPDEDASPSPADSRGGRPKKRRT